METMDFMKQWAEAIQVQGRIEENNKLSVKP